MKTRFAEDRVRRADKSETDEFRRAWLIVARDWFATAAQAELEFRDTLTKPVTSSTLRMQPTIYAANVTVYLNPAR